MTRNALYILTPMAVLALLAPGLACTWRTEHKVETVHKIDAHIVLDIRQIREEAAEVESYVRNGDAAADSAAPTGGQGAAAPQATPVSWATPPAGSETRAVARRGWLELLDPAGSAWAADERPARDEKRARERKATGDEALERGARERGTRDRGDRDARGGDAGGVRRDGSEPGGDKERHVKESFDEQEKKALDARKKRFPEVSEGLTRGALGENDKGYLDVLMKDEARARWDKVARDENRDRRAVYEGIARRKSAGGQKLAAVEVIFAETNRDKLKAGQMFQAPRDREFFEAFRTSALGRKYPDCKPGQWLKKR